MEEIKIKKNSFKIIFYLIIGVLFGLLCLDMFMNPTKYISFVFRYELFIKIFGLVGYSFSVLSVFLIAIKYFKNSFGLIINKNGIIDNSSVTSVGLIEWKDIRGIRQNKIMSTQFLLIDVYDYEKYINKSKNAFVSMLLKTDLKTYGTPISISNKSLKCSFKELESIINEQYQLHTNKN